MTRPANIRGNRILRAARKLCSAKDGATAVEFALVSPPLLLLLFVIIEMALLSWLARDLERSLEVVARPVLTGSFQSSGAQSTQQALAQIKQSLCSKSPLVNCAKLLIDLQISTSFAAVSDFSAFDPSTRDWTSGFGSNYTCAAPGSIVVLRAATKFPVLFPFLVPISQTFNDGTKLVQANLIFRTEPYAASSSSSSGTSSSSTSTSSSTAAGGC